VKAPYNISNLNQKAALNALENSSEIEKQRALILEQKTWLQQELVKIPLILKVFPSDANFLLVETTDANGIYTELVNRKIVTRNRNSLVKNCIRITVGTPDENENLIACLKNI
jgi:histidinol-phosphate aminotransferase